MSIATLPTPSSPVVVLDNVDWETYETLRAIDANRNVRMTYDKGALILMSPSKLHERVAELLAQLVMVWTEVYEIPRLSAGSTTIRKKLLKQGFEPDKCFFIQHEPEVRGREEFDPDIDPPPDLSIEVDVTSTSSERMPLYAAFGIPEIWRWYNEQIIVYRLGGQTYQQVQESTCLPGFPFDEASRTLTSRLDYDETLLVRKFRTFAERIKKA
jgi:Uma2 family endonuclease